MTNSREETVVRELPQVSKYTVRILERERIDVREHIENDRFRGFTRKGIRLTFSEFDQLAESVAVYRREKQG